MAQATIAAMINPMILAMATPSPEEEEEEEEEEAKTVRRTVSVRIGEG